MTCNNDYLKKIEVVKVRLSEPEREFYMSIYQRSKSICNVYEMEDGSAIKLIPSKLSKYAALFALLLRIRQACDHPYLVISKYRENSKSSTTISGADKEEIDESEPGASVDLSKLFGSEFLSSLYNKLETSLKERLPAYMQQVMENLQEYKKIKFSECPICLEHRSVGCHS